MPQGNLPNKRSYRRLKAAYLVKYETGRAGEDPRITNVRDISAGGMIFLARDLLAESSIIKLTLMAPPDGRTFEVHAQVLRVRRTSKYFIYSVAVSFVDMDPKNQAALESFIENVARHENMENRAGRPGGRAK